MGKKSLNPPKIFHVNWFRTNEKGEFIWPGYSDNFRVIEWIINRCENLVDADESPVGYLPKYGDINTDGLEISDEQLKSLLSIDKESWAEDIKGIEEFFNKFGDKLPVELKEELNILKNNIK